MYAHRLLQVGLWMEQTGVPTERIPRIYAQPSCKCPAALVFVSGSTIYLFIDERITA